MIVRIAIRLIESSIDSLFALTSDCLLLRALFRLLRVSSSFLKKEASYFCKRPEHFERDSEIGKKRKAREGLEDAPAEEPQKPEETVPMTTVRSRRIGTRKRVSPGMKRKAGEGFKVVIQSPLPQDASARAPVEEPQKPGETVPTATVKEPRILTRRGLPLGTLGRQVAQL
ncbi:hypothetical protein CDL15_Pgr001237 [Punica granatum]|uniref:Uncharacterized protein n=1 Tax=Punica granatum TaxID=22663 RepID=A0A218WKL5_PUNGR|nr:hypothetical protein CDL15_Pgr001237 [Punica granatum]